MKRYLINFSYIGTSYRGSQKHSSDNVIDVDSVQGSIESSFLSFKDRNFQNAPALVMAGRTDAGVHALKTTAHFDVEHKNGNTYFNGENTTRLMNRYFINCGHDIRVFNCHEVSANFHARHSAKSRTYLYRFLIAKDAANHKVPIAELNRSMHINTYPQQFDIDRLRQGLELFKGMKDFRTFTSRKLGRNSIAEDIKSYRRTLDVRIEEAKPLMPFDSLAENFYYWHIIFTSKSFLYNQIRRIMGALVALGSNKISEKDIITMLQVPSHKNWNAKASPAPPHGLYLKNVEYEKEDIQEICNGCN